MKIKYPCFVAATFCFANLAAQSPSISLNLATHQIVAEYLAGTRGDPESDVGLTVLPTHAVVRSNVRRLPSRHVNAIAYQTFRDVFPNGSPIGFGRYRYSLELRLPKLPAPNASQVDNAQAAQFMIQFFDSLSRIASIGKRTLEAAVYWQLNAWQSDFGRLYVYTGTGTPRLIDTGVTLVPDTNWHRITLVADLNDNSSEYVELQVDANPAVSLKGIRLAQVDHPEWDPVLIINLTAESLAAYPSLPGHIFTWDVEYRNAAFAQLESFPSSRFANLSVLSDVSLGAANVGFVITGSRPKKVLVRGVGPALGAFSVASFAQDPRLTIIDADGRTISTNDNWLAGDAPAMASAGAFQLPAGSRDSAVITTLAPGRYTLRIEQTTGSGTVLAEVYEVP